MSSSCTKKSSGTLCFESVCVCVCVCMQTCYMIRQSFSTLPCKLSVHLCSFSVSLPFPLSLYFFTYLQAYLCALLSLFLSPPLKDSNTGEKEFLVGSYVRYFNDYVLLLILHNNDTGNHNCKLSG